MHLSMDLNGFVIDLISERLNLGPWMPWMVGLNELHLAISHGISIAWNGEGSWIPVNNDQGWSISYKATWKVPEKCLKRRRPIDSTETIDHFKEHISMAGLIVILASWPLDWLVTSITLNVNLSKSTCKIQSAWRPMISTLKTIEIHISIVYTIIIKVFHIICLV